jgi:hypothetical protein
VASLDSREAPSALFGGGGIGNVNPTAPLMQGAAVVGNQAPSISDFRAIVGPNGQVTFMGRVTDDQAVAGYVVRIVGTGVDASAIVQNDGTFHVTIELHSPHEVTVSATVTDVHGAKSNPVYTTFTPSN